MSAQNNGGPAFPVDTRSTVSDQSGEFGHQTSPSTWQFAGMTQRDYFAAHAPAVPDWFEPIRADRVVDGLHGERRLIRNQVDHAATFIAWRWHYADAMLAAREAS